MKIKIFLFSLLAALLPASALFATHNFSGEIVYRKTGPLTVEAQVITYTNAASVQSDRDTITICWGDGICEQIVRTNGNGDGVLLSPEIKWNVYTGTHTYAAEGIYTLYMTDPNRSAGILNINPPASDNVPFHLQAMVILLPQAAGSTESPVLLAVPIDIGVVGQPFIHNPNAYSAPGDSIAYELITPLQGPGVPVPNYLFPNEVGGGSNTLSLNPLTGKLIWDAPQIPGLYVIAILVKFYRDDLLVGTIMRDMMIEIEEALNAQPVTTPGAPGCSLFPNPTAGELTFEWNHPTAKNTSIQIADQHGRTLRSLDVPDPAIRLTTGVGEFPPGIYFAKILAGGKLLQTVRFVKE